MSARRIPCPYTPARLHEMYWREGKSLKDIGTLTGHSLTLVQRWLDDAGISRRSLSEALKIEHAKNPDRPKPPTNLVGRRENGFRPKDPRITKANRTRKAKSRPLLTRPCCWWSCLVAVTRAYPSAFRAAVWFCGASCAAKYRHATRATQDDCEQIARDWRREHGMQE